MCCSRLPTPAARPGHRGRSLPPCGRRGCRPRVFLPGALTRQHFPGLSPAPRRERTPVWPARRGSRRHQAPARAAPCRPRSTSASSPACPCRLRRACNWNYRRGSWRPRPPSALPGREGKRRAEPIPFSFPAPALSVRKPPVEAFRHRRCTGRTTPSPAPSRARRSFPAVRARGNTL